MTNRSKFAAIVLALFVSAILSIPAAAAPR
jgi:hypothetical protein